MLDNNNSNASATTVPETPYAAAIVDHVTKYVGKPAFVLHEITSELFHLDVHVVPPTEERDFWFLFTTGMSALKMNTPYGTPARPRAEVSISLPREWSFDREQWKREPRWYWPIAELKSAARLPHRTRSWFGYGHTLSTPNEAPYAENTKLAAMMLLRSWSFPDQLHVVRAGLTEIDLWTLWPLYPEELKFTKHYGAHAFADLIEESEVSDVVDLDRLNLVGSRPFTQPVARGADTSGMKNKITISDVPGIETTIEPIPEGVDPVAFLKQQMDDCPLCREARARGEVPEIHSGEELAAMVRRSRPSRFAKRPRWRAMKKRR